MIGQPRNLIKKLREVENSTLLRPDLVFRELNIYDLILERYGFMKYELTHLLYGSS